MKTRIKVKTISIMRLGSKLFKKTPISEPAITIGSITVAIL